MTALGACQDSGSSICLMMSLRYNCPMSITCPTNWLLRPIRNGMEAVGRKSQQGLELMTTRDASLKHAKAIPCWLAIRTVQMGMLYPNIITMRGLRCLQKTFGAMYTEDPLYWTIGTALRSFILKTYRMKIPCLCDSQPWQECGLMREL